MSIIGDSFLTKADTSTHKLQCRNKINIYETFGKILLFNEVVCTVIITSCV